MIVSDQIAQQNILDIIGNEKALEAKNTPPRAPLVLRIGVTGHRPESDDLPDDKRKRPIPNIQTIRRTIKDVLEVIQVSFKGVAETNGKLFDLTPSLVSQPSGGTLRIVSALAAGADQWVALEGIDLGFELQSILPFHREEYVKDFTIQSDVDIYRQLLTRTTAILELDGKLGLDNSGNRKPDSQSYEAVGRALLNQTDLLIAIWDGKDAQGKGGTGQVVREALQNGIPVVWIPWSSPEKWQLQTHSWRLLEETADLSGDSVRLSELVGKLLLPPSEILQEDIESGKSLRIEYFIENQKSGNPHLGMWLFFRNLICGDLFHKGCRKKLMDGFRVEDFVKSETTKSEKFWNFKSGNVKMGHPIDEKTQAWINERYTKHYAWANGLSMFYGDMHRSAFLLNYLLGALAVFLALVCIAFSIAGKDQTGWIIAELVVIIGILALTQRGMTRKWHQRWIDYRTLAEHLRLSRCLILLGGGRPQVIYIGHLSTYGNPAHTWMNWHCRAIERAAGVPPLLFNDEYLISCQELWRDGLIKGQIDYHSISFKRFKKLDRRLHRSGDLLFIATLVACMIHLAHLWLESDPRFNWIPENIGGWMILLCAFLPALGAAFAAIRSHGEVQRLAQRSKAMEATLSILQADIAKIPVAGKLLNSVRLRSQADRVSDLMTNEMLDWRVVFQDRPLGLPT